MSGLDKQVVAWSRWVLRNRRAVLACTLLGVLVVALGAPRLTLDKSYRVYFDEDDSSLLNYDALQDAYAKSDSILMAIAPTEGEVFSPDVIAAVGQLTEAAWRLPFSSRVESLTNFQFSRAEGDDLVVGELIENPLAVTDPQVAEVRRIALEDPLIRNRLVSADARVTGVNVTMNIPTGSPDGLERAVTAARALARETEARHPGLRVRLTGVVMLDYAFEENTRRDMMTLVPLMFGIIVVVMGVMLGSAGGTVAALLVILCSFGVALGAAGWAGVALTPPSVTAPIMIMTLAIADTIHLLTTMFREMAAGRTKDEAIVESLRLNFEAVLITSLTTVIGFLSLNFSESRPFRDLGNITATGTVAAFVLSVLLMPALLSLMPVRFRRLAGARALSMDRLADFVVRRRTPLLAVAGAITVFFAAMIPRNDLNDRWVDYFAPRIPFRGDSEFVMRNLTGIYRLEYSLESGEPSGIGRPDYLRTLEGFRRWFERQPGVVHVVSYSEIAMRINKHMNGDDPAHYRVPETRELGAQYHLLYTMSLPMGQGLDNRVDLDASATRFTVTIGNLTTKELRALVAEADDWLRANAPAGMWGEPSSPSVMFSHVSERNLRQMVRGSVLALALITISMILTMRSLAYGLISIVPNLVPAVIGFGVWALWRGEIGLSLSTVTTMTLGIVVDDTVHFLSKYLRARRENGLGPVESVRHAFRSVGNAMLTTSVILAAGFLVLSLSAYRLNSWMGQLTAVTIIAALLADFFLLPPLLLRLEAWRSRCSKRSPPAAGGLEVVGS